MLVVFSEPIDAATLTASSVTLLLNEVPVAGTLEFGDPANLAATFTPAELLGAGSEYVLHITQALEDLGGDALEAPVTVEFTTRESQAVSGNQLVIVSGDGQEGKVGQPLAEALVVRVTNAQGVGVADVEVEWWSGEGALQGQFDPEAHTLSEISTRTNADGFTEVSLTPLYFTTLSAQAFLAADESSRVRFAADARDPGAALEIVSGTSQPGRAGHYLAEPFVVRMVDGEGNGVAGAPLHWRVTSGQGVWELDESGDPIRFSETYSTTDGDGVARTTLMPTWFGPVEVAADIPGLQPSFFVADATDPGVTVSVVSGDGQEGKAGEPVEEPLLVRITDGQGSPVPNIQMNWSGNGWFLEPTISDSEGLAKAFFSAWDVGRFTVTARPPGIGVNARSDFTTVITALVITLPVPASGFFWGFAGPYCEPYIPCEDWSVPVGTPVEWVNYRSAARIVSISAPPGGASFQSGTLGENGRLQFVPAVAGTWEYRDEVSGSTATLTAY